MDRLFKKISIRFQLTLCFLIIILLVVSLVVTLNNLVFKRTMEAKSYSNTMRNIEQASMGIESGIKSIEKILSYISQRPEVVEFCRLNIGSRKEYVDEIEENLQLQFQNLKRLYGEVMTVTIINNSGITCSDNKSQVLSDSFTYEKWYQSIYQKPGKIMVMGKPVGRSVMYNGEQVSTDEVLFIAKSISDSYDNHSTIGLVLVDVKIDIVKKTIENIVLNQDGFLYLTDLAGNIVYSPVNSVTYRIKSEWLSKSSSGSLMKYIKGNSYHIIYSTIPEYGWKLVGVFSNKEALSEVYATRNYILLIALAVFILAVFISVIFTSTIAKPIRNLRLLMEKVEKGDLHVRAIAGSNIEIHELAKGFNHMIDHISDLIEKVQREQKNKMRAELKVLQAQINPHFMYNTLDTLHWMAREYKAQDIIQVIQALTKLLRIGLSKGNEMITLQEEVEHIKCYLYIQKIRYENMLEYEVSMDEKIKSCKVIKLVLQPLVENAIYHGIKNKFSPGKVKITLSEKGGDLIFEIEDNGAGIPEEKLEQIRISLYDHTNRGQGNGIGLCNVHERIVMSFGDRYGISIHSTYGEGTIVLVKHPGLLMGESKDD